MSFFKKGGFDGIGKEDKCEKLLIHNILAKFELKIIRAGKSIKTKIPKLPCSNAMLKYFSIKILLFPNDIHKKLLHNV